MPNTQPDDLTAAEWKVMRILWRRKSAAARDVCEEAGRSHGWAVSTVKTLLRRLVDKGHVSTTRVGNSFLYRPATHPLKSLLGAADNLLDNAIDGTVGPLLSHLVRKSKLSPRELTELRALLDQHEPDARAK